MTNRSTVLNPFTVMAEQGYPAGCRAMAQTPKVGPPLWGTVVHNDGQILCVKWDRLEEFNEYTLSDEMQRYHEAIKTFESVVGPATDPIDAALVSFGGCAKPGRAYYPPGRHPDEIRARQSHEQTLYGRFAG